MDILVSLASPCWLIAKSSLMQKLPATGGWGLVLRWLVGLKVSGLCWPAGGQGCILALLAMGPVGVSEFLTTHCWLRLVPRGSLGWFSSAVVRVSSWVA